MRYIFLDIDGVLNSNLFFDKDYDYKSGTNEDEKYFSSNIDDIAIKLINQMCEKTGAVVVISSAWRGNWDCTMMFSLVGATFEIVGITGVSKCGNRGCEINKWLEENAEKPYTYVIFDDNDDMLYRQRDHFFQTDGYVGLTPTVVYKATNFLLK